MLDRALANARARRDESLAALCDELRIPSVSTLAEHRSDCRRNAEWLEARLSSLGLETELIDVVGDGHPVLRADWTRRPEAPLLTIYGHYDVQPPDPLEEWESNPFDPVVRDGIVVARGSADNKGNHLAAVMAAECWTAAGGPPVNLRFLIEGEEEIGGESLPMYLEDNAADLATDCVLLWDGAFSTDGRPMLCSGLRGMLYVQIRVQGAERDLHSGYGGVAPNAAQALAKIIGRLKDDDQRVTIPGFYDDVREPDAAEVARWHRQDEADLRRLVGGALIGESGFGVDERLWVRPTLDVNGMVSGFTGAGMKTVIPAQATAKVSMRLVPNQDPDAVFDAIQDHVAKLTPAAATATVTKLGGTAPLLCGYEHAGALAATTAFEAAFGRPPVLGRSGGSIPVASAFAEALGAPMVISGIATKDSGAHGPNERLYLDNFFGGIEMLVRFFKEFADAAG